MRHGCVMAACATRQPTQVRKLGLFARRFMHGLPDVPRKASTSEPVRFKWHRLFIFATGITSTGLTRRLQESSFKRTPQRKAPRSTIRGLSRFGTAKTKRRSYQQTTCRRATQEMVHLCSKYIRFHILHNLSSYHTQSTVDQYNL